MDLALSLSGSSPQNAVLLAGGVVVSLVLFYRWALPKPIPGIPYNKESVNSIFGDASSMVAHTSKTQEMFDWMVQQNVKLKSPIIQLFVRPFGKPWVVIADFRETQDIMVRRTKEFDRSIFFSEISGKITPSSHFSMRTDAGFRKHRRWIQGLMGLGFLHDTAAPRIYEAGLDLLQLWEQKSRIAKGHPFTAAEDIYRTAMDAIWAIVFGADPDNNVTKAQLRLYATIKSIELNNDLDTEAELPAAPFPAAVQSVLTLTDSVSTSIKSPVPKLAHWRLRQTATMKKAYKDKDVFLQEEIQKALNRVTGKKANEKLITCAIDDMIQREMLLAEKEKREPEVLSSGMSDEILGFIMGGHDTTATAITWGLKNLSDFQDVQSKLRDELHAHHAEAVAEKRLPTFQEINTTTVHYRDAVIEEILRCSNTEYGGIRTAMVDADVLGYRIPKGTEVFLMGNGPSIFSPEFEIDDSLRTPSGIESKDKIGVWKHKGMAEFDPERWMVEDKATGQKVFDPSAGPLLTFGLGERGCYGRRMAYVEMKLLITMIVWNFHLHKCPEALSTNAAIDKMTHVPQQCFVRPVKLLR
ncbi:uncharacterized protein TRIVIDRAFT_53375 [Trichoderma virens Gv29-8]|uniref:Cytochrome P450 monooxygenase n=1 Tax=Hypocrea virens (strain Gv29-8 / FGSC 10586) TaxID=413071 RepID=G9MUM7_HYPVG|nr:uncharacterized protein TRIVIDRAFT_53375 [Trichoderma virens Gv29-8]EHK21868.1 hypothetical protein TRIVIDRAFT_53375 [Trichoderma virens Gv29-8]UKZ55850.1 hypothetical protein TrVGV298_009674 [Trichoderma virens]